MRPGSLGRGEEAVEATATEKKDALVAGLEEKLGVGEGEAERTLGAVVDVLKAELLSGNAVQIQDFAALKVVERKAHIV